MWVVRVGVWCMLVLALALNAMGRSGPSLPGGRYWEAAGGGTTRLRKVAIIGAGPTGSSAAYYLKQAQDALQQHGTQERMEVTIYERNRRIGGRAAVAYPYDDEAFEPVELGASIYADVNYNLRRAVRQFKLETGAQNGEAGEMGVWDGQQFLFVGDASSWWTSAKFFLRYGYSAVTAQNLVAKQLGLFTRVYDPAFLHGSGWPWSTVGKLANAVNVSALAATTGLEYFKSQRVSDLFVEEMVEAATRVNYAQDTDQIHGFGALVSLAASGATGVKAGNYRIFEEFVQRSGARLLTGIQGEVTGIVRFDPHHPDEDPQWYVGTKSGEGDTYDAVILATPWHNADITLLNTEQRVKSHPFVHLHVTLLTTTAHSPDPRYFGLGIHDTVPKTILTSDESMRRASTHTDADPVTTASKQKELKLDLFSLNYLRPLRRRSASNATHTDAAAAAVASPPPAASTEYVVKIFSRAAMTDDQLTSLFGEDTVTWVRRHEWDAYPYLTPTTRFAHITVDKGLYNPSAMEPLVSTMETSTLAARNAVALLLRHWYGNSLVRGTNCSYPAAQYDPMHNDNWAGWGCHAG